MTGQEAIKHLTAFVYMEYENMPKQVIQALNIAKDAIKEIQQYREIGTVEECREAVEKQKTIEEIVNMQLIAGKNNYKETNRCFYEIVKVVQRN